MLALRRELPSCGICCLNPKIFRDYLNSNEFWNSDVFLFLQGRDENLFGTILGYRTLWRENYQGEKDFYSCLLYFDHSTARIERFLVNIQFSQSKYNKENFDHSDNIILEHYLPKTYKYFEDLSIADTTEILLLEEKEEYWKTERDKLYSTLFFISFKELKDFKYIMIFINIFFF